MFKWWYRFQLWYLGKPSGKFLGVAAIPALGFLVGIALLVVLAFTCGIIGGFSAGEFRSILPPIVVLAIVWGWGAFVIWLTYDYMKDGYFDIIYRQYLKNHQARKRQLLGKLNARSSR